MTDIENINNHNPDDELITDIDDETADELAYDAAIFELAMEAVEANNAFDLDDPSDSLTDDGSWFGR